MKLATAIPLPPQHPNTYWRRCKKSVPTFAGFNPYPNYYLNLYEGNAEDRETEGLKSWKHYNRIRKTPISLA